MCLYAGSRGKEAHRDRRLVEIHQVCSALLGMYVIGGQTNIVLTLDTVAILRVEQRDPVSSIGVLVAQYFGWR